MHTEVATSPALDAVRALTEVDDVEVALQDLLLAEPFLQLDREAGLAQLARDRVRGGLPLTVVEECVLHVLLSQRAAALNRSAVADVGRRCTKRAAQVDTAMVEEPRILDRDDRALHDRRDLRQGHVDAVLREEGLDRRAVGGYEATALRR